MKKTIQQHTLQISTRIKLILVFVLIFGLSKAQHADIMGRIIDEYQFPLMDVKITDGASTTYTDGNGEFSISVQANTEISLSFDLEGRLPYTETLYLSEGETKELFVMLAPDTESILLGEAVILQPLPEKPLNSISFDHATIDASIGITGGITEMIGSLPTVSVGSELSSQYRVRGGNYDENLIYVNGIEIYKPQLIRSGEQEGLGFVNPSMTDAVNFSAGGWEAKYGDKMSSVLDIIYKRPREFEATLEASLMGGNITVGGASKDKKFSAIVGARYQDRNLVLNTMDSNSDLNPVYYDLQANLHYKFNPKWEISFLGAITDSKFELIPKDRETKFGDRKSTRLNSSHVRIS